MLNWSVNSIENACIKYDYLKDTYVKNTFIKDVGAQNASNINIIKDIEMYLQLSWVSKLKQHNTKLKTKKMANYIENNLIDKTLKIRNVKLEIEV